MRWRWLASVILAVAIAGCGLITAPGSPSVPPVGPVMLDLIVSNGTTLPVTIVVNGEAVGVAVPGQPFEPLHALPPMPWTVEAKSPTGRLLTTMIVRREDISREVMGDGSIKMSGAGARIDLSCGVFKMSVGFPLSGPAPGPGAPGDCDP
jgi:hypothetical protein